MNPRARYYCYFIDGGIETIYKHHIVSNWQNCDSNFESLPDFLCITVVHIWGKNLKINNFFLKKVARHLPHTTARKINSRMDYIDIDIKVKTTELLEEIGEYLCDLQVTLFREETERINHKKRKT